ncbi:Abi family protein [Arthrobacter antibioticus]|uniref:Abi family protein n=1 Tax=Arthrobacter sp. H35-MC1 TaxID=3046203 RepID=UPI0024BACC50|nr:Abi family protein [Arthrobacter sp. H35-MC1]MDJ0318885.1 Abi family protein [Arthrobacter sp. H35-MC1]
MLLSRRMVIDDHDSAITQLRRVNYYRLSGYWYPFRVIANGKRTSDFFPGTTLDQVINLYDFDARLRTATLDALAPVELSLRALLGHELGRIDECAHLKPELLGPRGMRRDTSGKKVGSDPYLKWLTKYETGLDSSHEDFVSHHFDNYGGTLPVWAAVEILDLGSLRYLYGFAPSAVQNSVAQNFGLSVPQLESWMRCLEIVRNACAHHGRLFNRVYGKTPRLPDVNRFPDLDHAGPYMTKIFGQLTLIQHMRVMLGLERSRVLSAVLSSYPTVKPVPMAHLGAPEDWLSSSLWAR